MEAAIKTLVTTFINSSKGKDNIDGKSFQKMVSSQLGSMIEVRTHVVFFILHTFLKKSIQESVSLCNNSSLCVSVFVCVQDTGSKSAVSEMQRGLDENNDGKVSFKEYLTLIGYVATSLSQHKTGAPTDAS